MRRGLKSTVLGRRIEAVTVLWRPSFDVSQSTIEETVVGHRIIAIRRGRVLLLDLDDEQHLLVHPKMTGQLAVTENGTTGFVAGHGSPSMLAPMSHASTRVAFSLSAEAALYFNDSRESGWIRLVGPTRRRARSPGPPGPEPISEGFTPVHWANVSAANHERRSRRSPWTRRPLWASGNTDADESLQVARIDPRRAAGSPPSG